MKGTSATMPAQDGREFPDLPAGWTCARIGDLVGPDGVFTDGDWVESKDQDPAGEVRLVQLADVGDGLYLNRSSRFLTIRKAHELRCTFLMPEDILLARMPEPLGRACIFPGDGKPCVTVVDVCVIRSGEGGIDHCWLMSFINSPAFRASVEGLQSGSTRKRISRGNLATLFLPVPPLAEQNRIVAEIEKQFSRLDAGVSALERVRASLKRYRAAVLQAACNGRLVPPEAELARTEGRDYEPASHLLERILAQRRARWEEEQRAKMAARGKLPLDGAWEAKYQEPALPDSSDLPELPEGWAWASVEQLATVLQYGSSTKADDDPTHGVPVLRMGNIRDGALDIGDLKYINPEREEVGRYVLQPGDVLINRTNSAELVGKAALFSREGTFVFASYLLRLRLAVSKPLPGYLVFCINSQYGRSYVARVRHQVAGQANINSQDVYGFPVPLPPLAEMERIVAEVERRLSVVDELDALVAANLKRAQRLRHTILKRAFQGRLVPQSPDDEPARVLLDRIRRGHTGRATHGQAGRLTAHGTTPRRRSSMSNTDSKGAARPLLQVLIDAGGRLTPEELFRGAGYDKESAEAIDAFYDELRTLVKDGQVRQDPSDSASIHLEVVTP